MKEEIALLKRIAENFEAIVARQKRDDMEEERSKNITFGMIVMGATILLIVLMFRIIFSTNSLM